jgi:hypothetical protein
MVLDRGHRLATRSSDDKNIDRNSAERVFVCLALWLDVYPVDLAAVAEKVPPHEHAAAAEHADLDDRHVTVDELLKAAVIDLEVASADGSS